MSKFVKIRTELRDPALIKHSLSDLRVPYKENARYKHIFSDFEDVVPLLVTVPGAKFGLRDVDGVYEVVGDDMQLKRIQSIMQRVQQRYAYHKVLAETADAGFELVEEQSGRDGVIRLTVRKWS
jgi:hypothetical protein